MTPAASAHFVSAELSEFLYAPIGSENNGMTLSVLSALTRLNVDPWDEAAQLCELPKHAAAARLGSLIARLPAGSWTHADCQAIAEHLIEFLPHRSSSLQDARGSRRINLSAVPIIIAVALGLAALLIAASCEPSRADGINQGQSPFKRGTGIAPSQRSWPKEFCTAMAAAANQCARPPRICDVMFALDPGRFLKVGYADRNHLLAQSKFERFGENSQRFSVSTALRG
jgi:hypothetical protein